MSHSIVTVTHVTITTVTPSLFIKFKIRRREKNQKKNKRNLNNKREVEKKQVYCS